MIVADPKIRDDTSLNDLSLNSTDILVFIVFLDLQKERSSLPLRIFSADHCPILR